MRGSAKNPPRGIREQTGMNLPAQDSPHRATLCPCALPPSSSSSFPAWLSPKNPFPVAALPPHCSEQHILLSPLPRLILSALFQLCPNPGFQGLIPCFPPPLPGPSASSSSQSSGKGSGGALTAVGQVMCSGSCKESRAGCQGGPSAPGHAELPILSPTDPPWGSPQGWGIPECPQRAL